MIEPSGGRQTQRLGVGLAGRAGRVSVVPFVAPAWSADGKQLAFLGGRGKDGPINIFVLPAGGGGPRAVPHTTGASNPVIAPDGHTLAFSRTRSRTQEFDIRDVLDGSAPEEFESYFSEAIWLVDLNGGKSRQLTPWRNGLGYAPTSFSPDGSTLLATMNDAGLDGPRVAELNLADGSSRVLLHKSQEAVYSPDGSRIAFISFLSHDLIRAEEDENYLAPDLYSASADGSGVRRLGRSKGLIESAPTWDPSGERVAFVQARGDTSFIPELGNLFPLGNSVMQINADGTCRSKVVSRPRTAFYGAAWRPGPERGVGPLSC